MTNSPEFQSDVLIIGAGPVGMTLALTLQRVGVQTLIVDKAPTTRQFSQAAILWPRTLDVLDLLGIVDDWTGKTAPIEGFDLVIDQTRSHLALHLPNSPHAQPQGVGQDVTERLLDARLRQTQVDYRRGIELTDLRVNPTSVDATVRTETGDEQTVRTKWVVGCEGSRSIVREKALIAQVGDRNAGVQIIQGDVRIGGSFTLVPGRGGLWSNRHQLAMFVMPIDPEGFYRVLVTMPEDGTKDDPTLEQLEKLAREFIPDITLTDPRWLNRYRTQHRLATHYRAGRALLAGDAAHVWVPVGGQGMNIGMQDAFDLGWKLAGVVQGQYAESVLDTYHSERHPIGAQNIAATERLYGALLDPQSWLDMGLRKVVPSLVGFSSVEDKVGQRFAGLDLHYAESCIVEEQSHSDGPKAGMLAPDAWVNQGGQTIRLYDWYRTGHWLMLGWVLNDADQSAQQVLEQLASTLPTFPIDWMLIDATSSGVKEWTGLTLRDIPQLAVTAFGVDEPMLHVIRPDGIIGYRGATEIAPLTAYFNALLTPIGVSSSV